MRTLLPLTLLAVYVAGCTDNSSDPESESESNIDTEIEARPTFLEPNAATLQAEIYVDDQGMATDFQNVTLDGTFDAISAVYVILRDEDRFTLNDPDSYCVLQYNLSGKINEEASADTPYAWSASLRQPTAEEYEAASNNPDFDFATDIADAANFEPFQTTCLDLLEPGTVTESSLNLYGRSIVRRIGAVAPQSPFVADLLAQSDPTGSFADEWPYYLSAAFEVPGQNGLEWVEGYTRVFAGQDGVVQYDGNGPSSPSLLTEAVSPDPVIGVSDKLLMLYWPWIMNI